MSYAESERFSTVGGIQFRYESPFPWDDVPFMVFGSVTDARYPDVTPMGTVHGHDIFFPVSDMVIREPNKPPLLFTGAHNRLLHYSMTSLPRDKHRSLVLLDDHNDVFLGSDNNLDFHDIHIGNWGSAGVIEGYWGSIYHMDWKYHTRNGVVTMPDNLTVPTETGLMSIQFTQLDITKQRECLDYLYRKIGDRPAMISIDADEFADWHRDLSYSELDLSILFGGLMRLPHVDLIHFTPSPVYCPYPHAVTEWDALRQAYAQA